VNAWRIYPPWTIGAVLADVIIESSALGDHAVFWHSQIAMTTETYSEVPTAQTSVARHRVEGR
jgi:hypothetical protein